MAKNASKKNNSVAEKLGHFLSDTFVLYVKTLNYHWNMVGEEFIMYHLLLEKQYEELAEASDTIAERIRMLSSLAPATMKDFLSLTTLKEGKSNLSQVAMIRELVKDHETVIEHCRHLITLSQNEKDEGSADLLIDRLRAHDKHAWFLRSHLEKR